MLLSVVTFIVDFKTANLSAFRNSSYSNLLPVRITYKIPGYIKDEVVNSLLFNSYLKAKNSELLRRNLMLQASITAYDALILENSKLKSLLDNNYLSANKLKLVDVIDDLSTDYTQKLVINMGSDHQLAVGMPVVDENGLIGEIEEVFSNRAVVIMITDPSHAVPVLNNRTGIRTIVFGNGKTNMVKVPFYPSTETKLEHGDVFVTSGLGGKYPYGIPVGKITRIEAKSSEPFADVSLQAFGGFRKNRTIMVVKSL